MKTVPIIRAHGKWPDLGDLKDEKVTSVKLQHQDSSLILTFETGDSITIPAPWQFASCLIGISSHEFGEDPESDPDCEDMDSTLIGLVGARLSTIESDTGHLDLVFDSIRISLIAPTQ